MTRRRPPLSAEDRRLWAEVARSVRPLRDRSVPDPDPETREAAAEPVLPPSGPAGSRPARAVVRPAAPPARPGPPPLAPLERRTARSLARGRTRPAATLDLHGMTQLEAHGRLLGFLRRAQVADHGLVLVITGRGRDGGERGVLRRSVPLWLGLPELRSLVIGFDEAGPRQGGAGALYVRLRRRMPPLPD